MRALTVKAHFAHAIAHLGKRCENRSKPIPRARIGERIAIHAGASLPRGWNQEIELATGGAFHGWDGNLEAGWTQPTWGPGPTMPVATRAIVATAILMGCESHKALHAGRWMAGPLEPPDGWNLRWADDEAAWRWCLADVVTLAEPIPYQRGQLGIWTMTDDVASRLAG